MASSNFCSHHHFLWWPPLRKIAASTGAKVSALKAEIAMENAMVSANWRNRMPVVPVKNATGTNTAQITSHVADRLAHRVGGVEGDSGVHAGREALLKTLQFSNCLAVHVERVRRRELRYSDSNRIVSVELQIGGVTLRAQFGMPDIFQADQRAIRVRLKNNVVELRRLTQAADGAHADLVLLSGHRRLLADLSRRDFDVLLRERIHHVRRSQCSSRHPHRIQPKAHRVFALAEHDHVGDSRNTLDRVLPLNPNLLPHSHRALPSAVANYIG